MTIWAVTPAKGYGELLQLYEFGNEDLFRFQGGKPRARVWRPVEVRIETLEQGQILGNFLRMSGAGFTCDIKALHILTPLIGHMVEFLPLHCEDSEFFMINVIKVIDCLDTERSEFEHLSYKRIPRVSKYVFKANCVDDTSIFKIPENLGATFVTNSFKNSVENNGLIGLEFRKVWEE